MGVMQIGRTRLRRAFDRLRSRRLIYSAYQLCSCLLQDSTHRHGPDLVANSLMLDRRQSRARRALVAWQEGRLASEQRCRARGQGTARTTGGQYAPARPQLPEEEVVAYRTREVLGKLTRAEIEGTSRKLHQT